jgi:hypothetical protein
MKYLLLVLSLTAGSAHASWMNAPADPVWVLLDVEAIMERDLKRQGIFKESNRRVTLSVFRYASVLGGAKPAYCPPIPQVPLPAGAWLFGSALAGLGLVARRRKHERGLV